MLTRILICELKACRTFFHQSDTALSISYALILNTAHVTEDNSTPTLVIHYQQCCDKAVAYDKLTKDMLLSAAFCSLQMNFQGKFIPACSKSKVKYTLFCIALYHDSSPKVQSAQVWHVLTRDHTVLPATHTFIHKWNEPYLPLLRSRRASPHFGWYSFPVPLSVGG